MKVEFLINKNTLVLMDGEETRTYTKDQPEYSQLIPLLLAEDEVAVHSILHGVKEKIQKANYEGFEVKEGLIFRNGEELPKYLGERLKAFADEGADYKYLLLFWDNLKSNPSFNSVNSLYNFLEKNHCAITPEGYFLAYKTVRSDFTDKHTGKFDNSVGQVVSIPRNKVDDNFNVDCSYGLHVGSWEYVLGFGGGTDKYIQVLVNPSDVVSVPHSDHNKIRVCSYEVFKEITRETPAVTTQIFETWDDDDSYDPDDDDDDWNENDTDWEDEDDYDDDDSSW